MYKRRNKNNKITKKKLLYNLPDLTIRVYHQVFFCSGFYKQRGSMRYQEGVCSENEGGRGGQRKSQPQAQRRKKRTLSLSLKIRRTMK
jgi:hypothetical protein